MKKIFDLDYAAVEERILIMFKHMNPSDRKKLSAKPSFARTSKPSKIERTLLFIDKYSLGPIKFSLPKFK